MPAGSPSTGTDARPSAPAPAHLRDWSERRLHLAGAAALPLALEPRWLAQDLDSRILRVTRAGPRETRSRRGVEHRATLADR